MSNSCNTISKEVKKMTKKKLRKILDSAKPKKVELIRKMKIHKEKRRVSLIGTITWFLDEYRENIKIRHLVEMENIIENNYGDKIAKDWLSQ